MSMNGNIFLYVWDQRENITVTFSTTMYDKHFPKYEYEAITFSCKYESEEKT
jgi:hypothetical protein